MDVIHYEAQRRVLNFVMSGLAWQHAPPLHLSTASHSVFLRPCDLCRRVYSLASFFCLRRAGVPPEAVAFQHRPEKGHSVHPGGQGRRHWELHLRGAVRWLFSPADDRTHSDW